MHDVDGKVVGLHCRRRRGSWCVIGGAIRPLVISNSKAGLSSATDIHLFESQWDAFALMDRLNLYKSTDQVAIVTRGANNGKLVTGLIPAGKKVLAYPQNDEVKNGRRAADAWLEAVCKYAGVPVHVVKTPEKRKDLERLDTGRSEGGSYLWRNPCSRHRRAHIAGVNNGRAQAAID